MDKALDRKQKASRNRAKAKTKLARLHARIRNIRYDELHKLTTRLMRYYRVIGIEDLNPAGIIRNRFLARTLLDRAFGELRRQLQYKAEFYEATLVIVNKWFPSSKRRSNCGAVSKHVVWGVQTWRCSHCGVPHSRDDNAAKNLYLAASSAVKAYGAEGSGRLIRAGETGCYEVGRLADACRDGLEVVGLTSLGEQAGV